MKKIFTLAIALLGFGGLANAQSLQLINNLAPLTNGSFIYESTIPNHTTTTDVDFKNVSNATKTYGVVRTDLMVNSGADVYFCFGGLCFSPATYTATSAYHVTLSPGQSASALGANYALTADIDEAATVGMSEVRYKFYNVNDANDTASVVIRYNNPLSVNTIAASDYTISEVFPNPASSKAVINVNITKEAVATMNVYNALGSVVATKTVVLSSGKNSIPVDVESLNTGMYFATLTLGNNKVTKRFIVSNR